jgi:tetratricopeptide (TPR) repeat protein
MRMGRTIPAARDGFARFRPTLYPRCVVFRRLVTGLVIWVAAVLFCVLALRRAFDLGAPHVHYVVAREQIESGEYEDGLARLRKTIDARPWHAPAHAWQGHALGKLGRYAEALAAYELAAELEPEVPWYRAGVAWALARLERYDHALASYEHALELDASSAFALQGRASVLEELGRYEEALVASERAALVDGRNAELHFVRFRAFQALGRPREADEAIGRVLALEPESAYALDCRAWYLSRIAACPDEALAFYDRLAAVSPDHAHLHENRGYVLVELERFAEALEAFDRALERNPREAHTHRARGRVLVALERFDEALEAYERSLALEPLDAEAIKGKVYAEYRLGRR